MPSVWALGILGYGNSHHDPGTATLFRQALDCGGRVHHLLQACGEEQNRAPDAADDLHDRYTLLLMIEILHHSIFTIYTVIITAIIPKGLVCAVMQDFYHQLVGLQARKYYLPSGLNHVNRT